MKSARQCKSASSNYAPGTGLLRLLSTSRLLSYALACSSAYALDSTHIRTPACTLTCTFAVSFPALLPESSPEISPAPCTLTCIPRLYPRPHHCMHSGLFPCPRYLAIACALAYTLASVLHPWRYKEVSRRNKHGVATADGSAEQPRDQWRLYAGGVAFHLCILLDQV